MPSVRVRFLGCGDAFSSGGRLHTCFHLDGGPEPILIDCGATALTALKRERIDPASIGWVALSHLHGDHFGGLPWLILDGRFAGRTAPLTISGPVGTAERLERAFEALYPGATANDFPFDVHHLEYVEGAELTLGPARVTPFEVIHQSGAPSYAVRVAYGGKLIAYSGDTEWTDSLLDAARGADVFICECNFFDKLASGHLSYETLAAKREQIECERIVLTHMGQEMLSRLDEVGFEAAADGVAFSV